MTFINDKFEHFKNTIDYDIIEGSICDDLELYIYKIFNNFDIHNILEIGFNGGISSGLMLSINDNIKITSIDIGYHNYIKNAKIHIDNLFPNRHELLIGDSRDIVPSLNQNYDFIFIDGGHREPVPQMDIINCKSISNQNTLLCIDDWCDVFGSDGVNQAIENSINSSIIVCLDRQISGRHGWGLFKYVYG